MVKRVVFCCLLAVMAQFVFAGDALDIALTGIGLTRDGFRVDTEAIKSRGNTAFKLSFFDQWFQHPLRIPFFEGYLREQMLGAKGAPQSMFDTCTIMLGTRTWRA
jgi:hypothetical protein